MASDGLGGPAAGADMLGQVIRQRVEELARRQQMAMEQQRLQQGQQQINQTGDYQRGEIQARKDAMAAAQVEKDRANTERNQEAFRGAQMVADEKTPAPVRLAIQYRNATGQNIPGEALKGQEPVKPMEVAPGGRLVDPTTHQELYHAPDKPKEPKDTSAGDASRLDRSYNHASDSLDKLRKPYDDLSQRLTKLHDALAQGTPQADALVAPELMTVMAGGMGSGLRLNEAEISRVIGGRSAWQNLQASAQHWALDPKSANSITPEQRQQIRALVQLTDDRVKQAHATLDEAGDSLVNAPDVNSHRQIMNRTRKALTGLTTGAGNTQSGGTIRARDPQGNLHEAPAGTALPAGWKQE